MLINFNNQPHPQMVMSDKWMNIGYEEEELKPYTEPVVNINDDGRKR